MVTDFPLFVNSTSVKSGAQNGFNAGNYTVSETGILGYTSTISGDCASDGSITLSVGDVKSCTITNDDNPGSILGHKYSDTDGDYLTTADQLPVAGWGISLYQCMTSWTPENCAILASSTTTGTDGSYSFTNLFGQMYRVIEELRSGWTPLFPADGIMDVNLAPGATENVNFINQGNLSITACKYEDSNGTQNGGNFTPVSNWNFTLGQTTQNTNDSNCTTFQNLTPGTYDVSELPLRDDGWYIADDSQGSRIVVLTNEDELVNFYNYQKGEISGTKWNDVNSNGEWEYWNDETTLSNWHIQLFEDNDGVKGAQVGADQITNSDGNYSFADVNPGDYFVCEDLQGGWIQTYPDFDQEYSNCHEVTVTSGQEYGGYDFGNFKLGRIHGYKYEDTNGNGYWDDGENAINGWEICLDNENWEGKECINTNYDGYFEFTGLEYGYYELTEDETNPDYQRTQPETSSTEILINSGSGFGEGDIHYFGNAPLTDIYGAKWSDNDGNEEWGEGEDLLGGWTIFLDENGNEQLDEGEEWTTTEDNTHSDNFGRYSFLISYLETIQSAKFNKKAGTRLILLIIFTRTKIQLTVTISRFPTMMSSMILVMNH